MTTRNIKKQIAKTTPATTLAESLPPNSAQLANTIQEHPSDNRIATLEIALRLIGPAHMSSRINLDLHYADADRSIGRAQ